MSLREVAFSLSWLYTQNLKVSREKIDRWWVGWVRALV